MGTARAPGLVALVLLALVPEAAHAGRLERLRRPPLGDTIAVNTHYGAPREMLEPAALASLAAAGVRRIRNDLDWASVERTPGVYDFATPGFDALVDVAEAAGLHVIFILDYGNPLYGPAQAVVDDTGRRAFAAYAAVAAVRYGGRGHVWEIWNEPNLPQFWGGGGARPDAAEYARLVTAAVPAIRAADPTAHVLVGSAFMAIPEIVRAIGGVPGLEFLAALFATGAHAQADGVTAHFYRGEAPETVATDVDAIHRLMETSGTVRPLWSGEWGYSTYDPAAPPTGINYLPAVTPARQAAYVTRMLLHNHVLGLAGSVLFKDRDRADPDPGNIEHHFGLLHHDLAPKLAGTAVATLARLVGDARVRGTLALGVDEHAVVFRARRDRVVALWSEREATWRLRARRSGARVLARDGADVTPRGLARGVRFTLAPDEGPVYLIGPITIRPGAGGSG